jgi:hypothetical protein
MNRTVSRRLERFGVRAAAAMPDRSFSMPIQFVNSEKRVTSTLLLENDKQTWTELEDGPEKRDLPKERGLRGMNLFRRSERLETRAKEFAAAHPEPHTIRFISVDKKVVSAFETATGKWTHFDPPRH